MGEPLPSKPRSAGGRRPRKGDCNCWKSFSGQEELRVAVGDIEPLGLCCLVPWAAVLVACCEGAPVNGCLGEERQKLPGWKAVNRGETHMGEVVLPSP